MRPYDGYIVDSVGWAYYRLGRYDDAAQTLEAAVLLVPGDPTINDHLGDALWKAGRKMDARFQWNHALTFGPEDTRKGRDRAEAEERADRLMAPSRRSRSEAARGQDQSVPACRRQARRRLSSLAKPGGVRRAGRCADAPKTRTDLSLVRGRAVRRGAGRRRRQSGAAGGARLGGEGGRAAAAKLTLTKNLPVASGIGGGSADAAAALRGCCRLVAARIWTRRRCATSPPLGSDVPVCVASSRRLDGGAGRDPDARCVAAAPAACCWSIPACGADQGCLRRA